MRVLIVDDAATFRLAITEALARIPGVEVVGSAPNGQIALRKARELEPDVVLLDVEMPVMDGLETLKALRTERPESAVLMFSAHTRRGAEQTIQALMLGARDFLTKPTGEGGLEEKVAWIAENLEPKLRALGPARRATDAARPRPARRVAAALPSEAGTERLARRRDVVAIGSSAGGLPVLRQLLAELPGSLGVPLVCVQHMPAGFTASLARSLERSSPGWTVAEAENGALLEPGVALIAPGGHHLEVRERGGVKVAVITDGPPRARCKPAADALFESVADAYGAGVLAVVCSGMGTDGTDGARQVDARGGAVIVQDEATSFVWGMPGSIVEAGLAWEQVPQDELADAIVRHVQGRTARRREAAR